MHDGSEVHGTGQILGRVVPIPPVLRLSVSGQQLKVVVSQIRNEASGNSMVEPSLVFSVPDEARTHCHVPLLGLRLQEGQLLGQKVPECRSLNMEKKQTLVSVPKGCWVLCARKLHKTTEKAVEITIRFWDPSALSPKPYSIVFCIAVQFKAREHLHFSGVGVSTTVVSRVVKASQKLGDVLVHVRLSVTMAVRDENPHLGDELGRRVQLHQAPSKMWYSGEQDSGVVGLNLNFNCLN